MALRKKHMEKTNTLAHNLYLPLDPEGPRGTTNDLATSCIHLCLSSITLCDYGKSSPVHSLTLSSHRFLCLSLFLVPLTVPGKINLPGRTIGRHVRITTLVHNLSESQTKLKGKVPVCLLLVKANTAENVYIVLSCLKKKCIFSPFWSKCCCYIYTVVN